MRPALALGLLAWAFVALIVVVVFDVFSRYAGVIGRDGLRWDPTDDES